MIEISRADPGSTAILGKRETEVNQAPRAL